MKQKLEKEKQRIEELLSSFAKETDPHVDNWTTKWPQVENADLEDEADKVEEYTSLLSIEQTLEKKLQNINIALDKIEKGDYGICEKCGKKIAAERLKLVPEARTCAKCLDA
jgi:DnaK suppressor protein